MTTVAVKGSTQAHSDLARTIVEYLQVRGAWVFRVHGHLGQMPGVGDALVCLRGRLISVEIKTGKAQMRPAQHRHKAEVEAAGGLHILARSVDDVEAALLAAGLVEERLLWPRREG